MSEEFNQMFHGYALQIVKRKEDILTRFIAQHGLNVEQVTEDRLTCVRWYVRTKNKPVVHSECLELS